MSECPARQKAGRVLISTQIAQERLKKKKKNKQMFVLDFIEKTLFAYLKCLSEFSVGQTFE